MVRNRNLGVAFISQYINAIKNHKTEVRVLKKDKVQTWSLGSHQLPMEIVVRNDGKHPRMSGQ